MTTDRELEWLRRAREFSQALAHEQDLDQLLPLILRSAIQLTEAERGFLVRLPEGPGKEVKVVVALGFDGQSLRGAAGQLSKTVVQRVLDQNRSVVTTREDDADILEASSVQERRVRSVICVPTRLRGTLCGALYLDNRFDRQAFQEGDIPCLEIFADQAALALETADLLAQGEERASELQAARSEIEALRAEVKPATTGLPLPTKAPRFGNLVGASSAMKTVYKQVERLARSHQPAVLIGEEGVGKTKIAAEIHQLSQRRNRPFLCAGFDGLDPRQHELELFGHRTLIGTIEPGVLEQASPGVVLLSGLEALDLRLQGKLVAALKSGTIQPVDSALERPLLTRVIAAFTVDPEQLVAEGRLREDLLCHLDSQRVWISPLRERTEDIPYLLSCFFAAQRADRFKLEEGVMSRLLDYDWPGNVRELENLATRAATQQEPLLRLRDLPAAAVPQAQGQKLPSGGLQQIKWDLIQAALVEANGNKSAAARRLGIPRSSLYRMLEREGQGED